MNDDVPTSISRAIALLDSVYGPVADPKFPWPMPTEEAGPCGDQQDDAPQRRYLWTDAFGVLAFVSLADMFETIDLKQANAYREAAHKLIDVVHGTLGKPRSSKSTDAMTVDSTMPSPTGYIGVRIGKVESRQVTDYGMRYDGQYFHYLDKWLLALARAGRVDDGIRIAKSSFPYFFDRGHDGTGWNGGIRWKLSVNGSPPPELERAHASDDTLVALIVFSILEHHKPPDVTLSLQEEIGLLQTALVGYRPRVTDDPLGWGLEALYDRFLEGRPRSTKLRALHSRALHPHHITSLPFRLYGAMIGARLAGPSVAQPSLVDELVELAWRHELQYIRNSTAAPGPVPAQKNVEHHSSINRVMLAMCLLCPGALRKTRDDPVVRLL